MLPLLESHVEPVDENTVHVIMPDGWTFVFYRNGNTDTWRGNAGWVGETNNTVLTITAPCGWRIKFDGGKIQKIDSDKNRLLTYKYNGAVATEVDVDGKMFVQVESDTATGVAQNLLVGDQRIDISLAQRPRIQILQGRNFVTGFDQSLNQLQWPDGKKETFTFGADKGLSPTLGITHSDRTQRNFTWDASTRQIKIDGEWAYAFPKDNAFALNRTNKQGQSAAYENDEGTGVLTERALNGIVTQTLYFTSGVLRGKVRKVITTNIGGIPTVDRYSYDEEGNLIRREKGNYKIEYAKDGRAVTVTVSGKEFLTTTTIDGKDVYRYEK